MAKTTRKRPGGPAAAPPGDGPGPGTRREARPALDRRTWLIAIPLFLIVVAAFTPALGNGFVDWDDESNFLRNRHYRGLGAAQVKWAWSTFLLGVYQPLSWLLLEVQYAVWGLDPRGYHLTSLLLHAANTVVLYALTVTLLVRCRPDPFRESPWACALGAGLATAMFAMHPLRVEPVAWVSCQPYLPCALFSMLAVLAYLRAVGEGPSPRWGWLAGSFGLALAAMLSKATAVSLPAVLLILDVYPLRRLGGGPGRWLGPPARRVWLEKVPFFAMSLVFAGLAVAAKTDARAVSPLDHDGVPARIAQACYGTWFYIVKTVIPRDITAFYPLPGRIDWYAPPFLLSILATLAVTLGLFLLRRRQPGLLAAWLSYLVLLAPGSGLVRIGDQIAADRYSYLPMTSGVLLVAAGLGLALASARRAQAQARGVAIVAGAGVAVLALFLLTRDQCRIWRTPETLWTHALEHGGGSSTAHANLAGTLFHQGRLGEATPHYAEVLRLDPENPTAHLNLGAILYHQGDLAAAEAHYAEALRLDPDNAEVHNNLGLLLADRGDLAAATAHYTEALRLDPDSVQAHVNLGVALARLGDFRTAAAHHAEAMRLDPDNAEAHNDLAMILAACPDATFRDGPRAVAVATRACDLTRWEQPGTLDTLAAAYAESGDFEAAVRWQTRAITMLADVPTKANYRSRLALYRAKTPYREPAPRGPETGASP